MRKIEEQLKLCKGLSEYPIFVKALIKRQEGNIKESLELFQAATHLNPQNVANLKQVGRSLFLLGKHKAAVGVYDEAQKLGIDDWEIWHNKGLCHKSTGDYDEAEDCFRNANAIQRHNATFLELGDMLMSQKNIEEALDTYSEALEFTPDSPQILEQIGLCQLKLGNDFKAFEAFGNAMTHDPRQCGSILAACSMLQEKDDIDVALIKYRVAAIYKPNAPELWNNVGMCFFGKRRYVAAIACLKKALYFGPCEWKIAHNLGLVHLHTGQYASAFHYFSQSINLNPLHASSYMLLAVALTRLDDAENAFSAYDRAVQLDPSNYLVHLNYAVALRNAGKSSRALDQFEEFDRLWAQLDDDAKDADQGAMRTSARLRSALQK